jgi:hypothetical protein
VSFLQDTAIRQAKQRALDDVAASRKEIQVCEPLQGSAAPCILPRNHKHPRWHDNSGQQAVAVLHHHQFII